MRNPLGSTMLWPTLRLLLLLLACHVVFSAAWHDVEPATPKSQILLVTMGGTKSHKIPFWALAKGLIAKGHNVTFLSGFPADNVQAGLEEITPMGLVEYIKNYTTYDLLGARLRNQMPISVWDALRYPVETCEALLSDPEGKELLHRKYDLVILDGAYPDCAFAYVHATKAPYMYVNTVGYWMGNVAKAGTPTPYSVTPVLFGTYTDNMNFLQRVHNLALSAAAGIMSQIMSGMVHNVLKSYIAEDIASPAQFAKNLSFTLQNGHFSVSYLRPYLPSVAEIGCIHCKPAKPLPKYLEDFVSGAGEGGFVYVSMGTSVRTENMPPQLLRTLVDAFAKLAPYRVLWKFEGTLGDSELPPNVKIERWLPQQDILGHKRLKAFVTHAGLLSMFETAYHGVPVVMMPVFCDQDANAAKAVADGYGIKIELSELSTDKLVRAVTSLIVNPRYRLAASRVQTLIKDQRMTPLETGVYWTEYVLRHKGAPHMASPARDLNWFQYYMYDVVVFFAAVLLASWTIYRRQKSYSIRIVRGESKQKVH